MVYKLLFYHGKGMPGFQQGLSGLSVEMRFGDRTFIWGILLQ
jgi:hypothetical protein